MHYTIFNIKISFLLSYLKSHFVLSIIYYCIVFTYTLGNNVLLYYNATSG